MGFTFRKEAGVYKQVANMFQKDAGVWKAANTLSHKVAGVMKNVYESEVVVTVTANTVDLMLSSLFDPADWTANKNKRVVINSGVVIGASSSSWAVAIQSGASTTAWGGTLTLENHGTIQGRGGVANSGVGGNAFYPGAYSYPGGKKLLLENYGTVRAGGGGGGRGGTGGGGYYNYTATEGEYYARSGGSYYVQDPGGGTGNSVWIWGGATIANASKGATTLPAGPYTYYRGSFRTSDNSTGVTRDYYAIYRQYVATAYTSGGSYGSGGKGQGHEGANTSGTAGSAGGTNAGTGGTGGTGGTWGQTGGTGFTGSSGNYSSGAAGVAGGAAGYAYPAAYTQIVIPGTILGRVA